MSRAWLYAPVAALGGCVTYDSPAKVRTVVGFVTSVEGGSARDETPKPFSFDGILSALWSMTGLAVVGLLLLAFAAWRFPAVRGLLTASKLRERAAAKRRLQEPP